MLERRDTFNQFCKKEVLKGIISYPTTLKLPRGQDTARLFFWRVLEEFVESINASEEAHRLEELIDTVNYAMGCLLLDPMVLSRTWPDMIYKTAKATWEIEPRIRNGRQPTTLTLATVAKELADLTEKFRNRSWMENSQDTYYLGLGEYEAVITGIINMLLWFFPDWDTFWRYFVAKDVVLKFRLRSNY